VAGDMGKEALRLACRSNTLKASLREGGGSQRLTEGVRGMVMLCRKKQRGEDEGDIGKEALRLVVLITLGL